MWFERISIKHFILAMLGGLGIVVMVLSLFMTQKFRQASLEFQEQSLQRMIASAAQTEMRALEKRAAELGEFALKDNNFKSLIGKLRSGEDVEARQRLLELLQSQFNQRFVTTGIVDLVLLRLYDKQLNLLVQTAAEGTTAPEAMNSGLWALAGAREGADRMKRIGGLWNWNDRPVHSTLIPVGGLRLAGYLEVVANPIHALRQLGTAIDMPVRLVSMAGIELEKSESWRTDAEANQHVVPVHMPDLGADGVLRIEAVEDFSDLNARIAAIQWQILAAFAALIGFGIFASLWVLRKALFIPVTETVQAMERVAAGDLTVIPSAKGLKELAAITRALSDLIGSVRADVLGVIDISHQLMSQANSLENVASGTNQGIQELQKEMAYIASAMTEMAATVQQVAGNANSAADAAQQADQESSSGRKVVADAVSVIESLAKEVESASAVILRLENETDTIGAVLDVIKGIAEQTNLLALNAAIEAARAGEQGRGFAVVADEVRTLASRTQQSTREIHDMIERLQTGAGEAVKAMEISRGRAGACVDQAIKAGSSLDNIAAAVGTINDMNTQIASAAEEQSAVAAEINRNANNISHVADVSAEGAQHTSAASEQLLQLSEQLRRQVGRFNVG